MLRMQIDQRKMSLSRNFAASNGFASPRRPSVIAMFCAMDLASGGGSLTGAAAYLLLVEQLGE